MPRYLSSLDLLICSRQVSLFSRCKIVSLQEPGSASSLICQQVERTQVLRLLLLFSTLPSHALKTSGIQMRPDAHHGDGSRKVWDCSCTLNRASTVMPSNDGLGTLTVEAIDGKPSMWPLSEVNTNELSWVPHIGDSCSSLHKLKLTQGSLAVRVRSQGIVRELYPTNVDWSRTPSS